MTQFVLVHGAWHGAWTTMRKRLLELAALFAICASASVAHGQVYKCTDASGKTTYADTPCAPASKPVKLPDDGRSNPADPHMCDQLLDETRRLAAEAERNAERGRTESSYNAKRRKALTRQYEARCAGISRAAPTQR